MVIGCCGDDLAVFVHDDHVLPPIQRAVNAAAMVRNPSNLVPVPAFQSMKITASVFDIRHIAHRPLCTDWHKIKPGTRNCKYPQRSRSRGPPRRVTLSEGS